jgi:hypothetical protein
MHIKVNKICIQMPVSEKLVRVLCHWCLITGTGGNNWFSSEEIIRIADNMPS